MTHFTFEQIATAINDIRSTYRWARETRYIDAEIVANKLDTGVETLWDSLPGGIRRATIEDERHLAIDYIEPVPFDSNGQRIATLSDVARLAPLACYHSSLDNEYNRSRAIGVGDPLSEWTLCIGYCGDPGYGASQADYILYQANNQALAENWEHGEDLVNCDAEALLDTPNMLANAVEVCDALEEYIVLDDCIHSRLESEAQWENWLEYAAAELLKQAVASMGLHDDDFLTDELDDHVEGENDLWSVYRNASENEYSDSGSELYPEGLCWPGIDYQAARQDADLNARVVRWAFDVLTDVQWSRLSRETQLALIPTGPHNDEARARRVVTTQAECLLPECTCKASECQNIVATVEPRATALDTLAAVARAVTTVTLERMCEGRAVALLAHYVNPAQCTLAV